MHTDDQMPTQGQTSQDHDTSISAPTEPRQRARRGFAVMSPERVRAFARRGGKAAHMAGTAHEFTTDEARAAGRKGGEIRRQRAAQATQSSPPPAETPTKTDEQQDHNLR